MASLAEKTNGITEKSLDEKISAFTDIWQRPTPDERCRDLDAIIDGIKTFVASVETTSLEPVSCCNNAVVTQALGRLARTRSHPDLPVVERIVYVCLTSESRSE